jgi:hypothetical protein
VADYALAHLVQARLGLGDADAAAAITTFDGQLVAATRGASHVPGSSVAGLAPFTRFLPAREHGLWAGEGLRPGEQQAARWPRLRCSSPYGSRH